MLSTPPKRGEIWMADLDPTRGHEQSGIRPVVILSVDRFNRSAATLVFVCPITSRNRNINSRVQIDPPEGGLTLTSYILTEQLRSITQERLIRKLGSISDETMEEVEDKVRILLGL